MIESEIVYKILCESPCPLMAKEIVKLIFEKHNGYKISKKDVKNILWKDLNGKIYFDNINFTYTLKEFINRKEINTTSVKNNIQISEKNIEIDGYSIIMIETSNDLGPLFWTTINGLKINIYLNIIHPKANFLKSQEGFIFLAAICRTSVSFSDESGKLFLNKFKNYVDII